MRTELQRSFAQACDRGDFRLVHYSIQRDHAHLIVEAADRRALAAGMKSLGARVARAAHRAFGTRGPVLDGRFHGVVLRSPRQVRNAIRYVLLNARKHGLRLRGIDPASSGDAFDGWKGPAAEPLRSPRRTARPRTWLLRRGWRRHGRIGIGEVPGPAP